MEENLLRRQPGRSAGFGTPGPGEPHPPSPRPAAAALGRRRGNKAAAAAAPPDPLPPGLPRFAAPAQGLAAGSHRARPRPAEGGPGGGARGLSPQHLTAPRRRSATHRAARAPPSRAERCAGAPRRQQVPRRRQRGRAVLASQPGPGAAP